MKSNLLDLIDDYNTDAKCRELLERLRWPNGVACLRCGDTSVSEIVERGQYDCNSCRYQFSVTAGTIMHDSHLPLHKWFIAVYMMCKSRKGVSALQLKQILGVAYKTAWYLSHRIRAAMDNGRFEGPTLFGVVQIAETLVAGKPRGKGGASRGKRTWVAGAIQRGGRVKLEAIPDVRRTTLRDFINRTVRDDTEAIYTDDLAGYMGIGDHTTTLGMRQSTTPIEEWVFGDMHPNSIEGVWSLFRKSLVGSFHKVSKKHLSRYLEELEWRFGNRNSDHIFLDTLRCIVSTNTLTYEQLVA